MAVCNYKAEVTPLKDELCQDCDLMIVQNFRYNTDTVTLPVIVCVFFSPKLILPHAAETWDGLVIQEACLFDYSKTALWLVTVETDKYLQMERKKHQVLLC